jgi:hypothetical protein
MQRDTKHTKIPYEAPQVMELGELARGRGLCQTGSGDAEECSIGNGVTGCMTGSHALEICVNGSHAGITCSNGGGN